MVLTMFSANPNFAGIAGRENPPAKTGRPSANAGGSAKLPDRSQPPSASAPSSASATASALPTGTIVTAGRQVSLRGLAKAAIAILPANCDCMRFLSRLVARAKADGVRMFLVGLFGSSTSAVRRMAGRSAAKNAVLAIDAHNTLYRRYHVLGLTVLLVDSHRHVRPTPKLTDLSSDGQIDRALRSLNA
jgi:hypothetical protein